MEICSQCQPPKRVPKKYAEAHTAWHNRDGQVRHPYTHSPEAEENLRLSRKLRKEKQQRSKKKQKK